MDTELQKTVLQNYFSLSDQKTEEIFKLIKQTQLCLVGCGATGSFLAELLLRTGFRSFILVDGDVVEEKNLSRQNYSFQDIRKAKVKALAESLKAIDSSVKTKIHPLMLNEGNKEKVLAEAKLIIECSDSFETKQLVSEYAKKNKISWIYTGLEKEELLLASFSVDKLNTFDTIFSQTKDKELSCDTALLNSSVSCLVSLVQIELIRLLLGEKASLTKVNLLNLESERIIL
jgi:adenylyltransferase/sulfurtransferase